MSRNTKRHKNVQRRSALSFAGADDSIDHYIDNIIQSDPWENVAEIRKSDAAYIQNVLNEFDDMITQEKASKASHSAAKKKLKQPKEKSAVKDSTTSEGTSSNMHNMLESKTKVQTKKKVSTKRTPKTIEKTPSQELQCSVDNAKRAVRKTSEPNIEKIAVNESVKEINKKDVTNTTDTNLLTSTPKKELSKTIGETAKGEKLSVNKKKQKMIDFENTSKKYVKHQKKQRQKSILKKEMKDMEDCQGEDNTKVSDKDDNLKVNESKNVLKENVETKLSKSTMKCNVVDEKCEFKNKKISSKLKNLKSCKDKLSKSATSKTSSKPLKNNVENTESQCKKCAENCRTYEQRLSTAGKQSKEKRELRKTKKAIKAMTKLSHDISAVKRKVECIKNNLESRESSDSGSDYSEESLYSSLYSFSSSFESSHSSDCSCSYCDYTSDDYTEYTCDSSNSSRLDLVRIAKTNKSK
ncbi:micronuclear linker histone polyprotein isoform X2 [Polyergus mexicanus]|uniref:micronuclear linker histone polyprotein isoform X2 n=1 Tax=Polyergus mexicanus TaxID=615972 RepID=UPI0038B51FA4